MPSVSQTVEETTEVPNVLQWASESLHLNIWSSKSDRLEHRGSTTFLRLPENWMQCRSRKGNQFGRSRKINFGNSPSGDWCYWLDFFPRLSWENAFKINKIQFLPENILRNTIRKETSNNQKLKNPQPITTSPCSFLKIICLTRCFLKSCLKELLRKPTLMNPRTKFVGKVASLVEGEFMLSKLNVQQKIIYNYSLLVFASFWGFFKKNLYLKVFYVVLTSTSPCCYSKWIHRVFFK